VGRDPNTDLALVKIEAKNADLTPLQVGDSDQLRVGSWVVAVGSPFGLEQTVTAGIVSAKGRVIGAGPYDDFIQTDASINPGNSGGPLLNLEGKVVGINSAILSRGGGNDGIGFAIPVNLAKGVIDQLKENGKVVRGWLGVAIQDVTPELQEYYKMGDDKGALIAQVYEGDPADQAGIQAGDVVIAVNGKEISASRDLSRVIANSPIGEKIPFTLLRDGKKRVVNVELIQRPDTSQTAVTRTPEGNGKLGLRVAELSPETATRLGFPETEKGLVVAGVEPGSKGAAAGIQKGDVIKEINHSSVQTVTELKKKVEKADAGDTLEFLVKRAGAGLLVVKVTV
jgi:serine protease Do